MHRSSWFRRRIGRHVGRLAATALVGVAGVVGAACGSDAGAEPARTSTLVLEAYEDGEVYGYRAVGPVDLRVGDRVTIDLRNVGAIIHDLAVIHPDGNTVAMLPAIAGGSTDTLELDLDDPGIYRFNCNVENHLTVHGMQAFIEVKNADGTSAA